MPRFMSFPHPRRHNSLRLLGYNYESIFQLCAISLVTDQRRPLFADIKLAKSILSTLLNEETLRDMRVRAFTLLPDHMHFLAGVRDPESYLPNLIGRFKSYTTQQYWKRAREVVAMNSVCLPPQSVAKVNPANRRILLAPILDWRATILPEAFELKNWPKLKAGQFLKKRLWQTRLFDHVIRNDEDLRENLDYIAMNSVRAGYVRLPQFYPYTGFLF
jgi:REP element-mobilizing transposase RayT